MQYERKSRLFRVRVWGENACFTRPEMKVERVSYDVMTPSAARGILEAILWKPAMSWRVHEIHVLRPIRWASIRRNEVSERISPGRSSLLVEENRVQRAGLILRDVAYVIHGSFVLTDRSGQDDNVRKFEEIFARRAAKGQCFHRPYLGCREFAAHFQLLDPNAPDPVPISESRDLGFMLYDMDFSREPPMPLWFRARIEDGRMRIPFPGSPEVRR